MATKNKLEEALFEQVQPQSQAKEVFYPPIHTMIRWISKNNISAPDGSYQNIMEVDADVGAWIMEGYRLVSTHYVSENPEAYGVMYILTK